MNRNKSGQTALILVIVTMVTALGIGVASSTQSNINLRNTVYSTQSEQALACAEAGAEAAFGELTSQDPGGNGGASVSPGAGTFDGVCDYSYSVASYPISGGGEVKIPSLNENAVQELYYDSTGRDLNFSVKPLTSNESTSLAVYIYKSNGEVERRFYGFDGSNIPNDFEDKSDTDSGGYHSFTVSIPNQTRFIRLRPVYSSLEIIIDNYPTTTAYKIDSTGIAGIVNRKVEAYRFFSQLPAAFDEAVVMLDTN